MFSLSSKPSLERSEIVGDEDTDFIIFGSRGECIDAGKNDEFSLMFVDRATFLFDRRF